MIGVVPQTRANNFYNSNEEQSRGKEDWRCKNNRKDSDHFTQHLSSEWPEPDAQWKIKIEQASRTVAPSILLAFSYFQLKGFSELDVICLNMNFNPNWTPVHFYIHKIFQQGILEM